MAEPVEGDVSKQPWTDLKMRSKVVELTEPEMDFREGSVMRIFQEILRPADAENMLSRAIYVLLQRMEDQECVLEYAELMYILASPNLPEVCISRGRDVPPKLVIGNPDLKTEK